MKWIKVSLKTTTEAVDLISALFDEIGLEGIEIQDHVPLSQEDKEKMFIDILPELPPDDGSAVVSSYVGTDTDIAELKEKIEAGLEDLKLFTDPGACELSFEEKDDKDWIDNWKEYFKPFYAMEHILIKPSWEELPEGTKKEDLVIEIDPGTAFGTGSHETTRLCMESIQNYMKPGAALLDVGCGSGILSIAGLKLGAGRAVGTDIDENAVRVAWENMERNGITGKEFTAFVGNLIDDTELQEKVGGGYDIVAANILADVIIPLSGEIAGHMKEDGVFISSGIINTKKEEVEKALLKNGFEILEVRQKKDWVSFAAKIRR